MHTYYCYGHSYETAGRISLEEQKRTFQVFTERNGKQYTVPSSSGLHWSFTKFTDSPVNIKLHCRTCVVKSYPDLRWWSSRLWSFWFCLLSWNLVSGWKQIVWTSLSCIIVKILWSRIHCYLNFTRLFWNRKHAKNQLYCSVSISSSLEWIAWSQFKHKLNKLELKKELITPGEPRWALRNPSIRSLSTWTAQVIQYRL